jgi:hypothetical protein
MTRLPFSAAALLAAAAALGGCAGQRPAPTRAEQAALADCRRQADAAYVKQHPELVTDQDQLRFSPFSSNTTIGITSAGLGEQYGRNQDFQACLNDARGAGAGGGAQPSGTETLTPGRGGSGSVGPVMTPGTSTLPPGSRP